MISIKYKPCVEKVGKVIGSLKGHKGYTLRYIDKPSRILLIKATLVKMWSFNCINKN